MHWADYEDLTAARDSLRLFLGTQKIAVASRPLRSFSPPCATSMQVTPQQNNMAAPPSVGDYQLLRCTKTGPCVPVLEPEWDPRTTGGPGGGGGCCLCYRWVGALV